MPSDVLFVLGEADCKRNARFVRSKAPITWPRELALGSRYLAALLARDNAMAPAMNSLP